MTNKKYLKRSSCIAQIYWGFYETRTMHVNKRSIDSQTYAVKKNIVVWFEFSLIWKIPLMTLSVCKIKNFNHKYHLKFSNWVDIFWNQHFIKKSAFYKCSQIFYIIKFTVFYWDVLTQHKICNKMRGHIGLRKKKKKKKYFSECLFRKFFRMQTVENVKNQKIHFDFVFLYKNESEKLVLPRIWEYYLFTPTPTEYASNVWQISLNMLE